MGEQNWYQKEKSFLRQYARAVVSDQLLGDEIVAAALNDFDSERIAQMDDRRRKIALFRAFYDTWGQARTSSDSAASFTREALLASGPNIAPAERQLALLVDVVGIGVDMAADLLELDADEARRMLDTEREALQKKKIDGSALIIEDEPLIAMDVSTLLETLGLKVAATARTAEAAVSKAAELRPDIVLADYDLGAGKTGLDAIKTIAADMPVIAVFLTAYPDEVLSGEDNEPTFVLAKPFNERALRTAVLHGMSLPRAEIIS